MLGQLRFTGFHRAAGNKDGGNVETHGGVEHSGGDLVAVGDAHYGIGAVCVDHVLHGVGNNVPRWQAVQHAVVAHGDAVVHGDGVELFGDPAGGLDLARYQLSQVFQVDMAGYKLGEGVNDGDDGLLEVVIFHTGGAPQCAGAGHVAAVRGGF